MAIPATQMRPGMIIKHNDELHTVFKVEHRTPGNLRAFIQAKLRNLRTGAMFEHRFRSADAIEKVIVDEVSMEFLYADGDDYYFMNPGELRADRAEGRHAGRCGRVPYSQSADQGSFFDGVAVGIELPQTVELTVVETEPGLKSATASSRHQAGQDWKPASSCRCRRSSTKAKRSASIRRKVLICHERNGTADWGGLRSAPKPYCAGPGIPTIHATPNLSVHMPNSGDQNVGASGI